MLLYIDNYVKRVKEDLHLAVLAGEVFLGFVYVMFNFPGSFQRLVMWMSGGDYIIVHYLVAMTDAIDALNSMFLNNTTWGLSDFLACIVVLSALYLVLLLSNDIKYLVMRTGSIGTRHSVLVIAFLGLSLGLTIIHSISWLGYFIFRLKAWLIIPLTVLFVVYMHRNNFLLEFFRRSKDVIVALLLFPM